jgi:hypothetical protein
MSRRRAWSEVLVTRAQRIADASTWSWANPSHAAQTNRAEVKIPENVRAKSTKTGGSKITWRLLRHSADPIPRTGRRESARHRSKHNSGLDRRTETVKQNQLRQAPCAWWSAKKIQQQDSMIAEHWGRALGALAPGVGMKRKAQALTLQLQKKKDSRQEEDGRNHGWCPARAEWRCRERNRRVARLRPSGTGLETYRPKKIRPSEQHREKIRERQQKRGWRLDRALEQEVTGSDRFLSRDKISSDNQTLELNLDGCKLK